MEPLCVKIIALITILRPLSEEMIFYKNGRERWMILIEKGSAKRFIFILFGIFFIMNIQWSS